MKKFLILGNINAITYKEVFPYIKNGDMWYGIKTVQEFIQPNGDMQKFGNIEWFTNLNKQTNKKLILTKTYNENDYPKYDNYNAINVDKVKDIPVDYTEPIGVPITVLQYLNSDGYITFETEQYEILGIDRYIEDNPEYGKRFKINNKEQYARVIIKKKLKFKIIEGLNRYTILDIENKNQWAKENHKHLTSINGTPKYFRIIIQRTT